MTHNLNSYREHIGNRIANITGKRFHSALALILRIVGRARKGSLCIAIHSMACALDARQQQQRTLSWTSVAIIDECLACPQEDASLARWQDRVVSF